MLRRNSNKIGEFKLADFGQEELYLRYDLFDHTQRIHLVEVDRSRLASISFEYMHSLVAPVCEIASVPGPGVVVTSWA